MWHASEGCESDNTGTEFAVAFTTNIAGNGAYELEVYPTSSSSSVDVQVRLAAGGWDHSVTLSSGRGSAVVDVPGEVQLNGTEISPHKAVLVTTASGT